MPVVRVEPSEDVIFQDVKDEIVLLNIKNQQYFGLDDVGAAMWRLLVEGGDVDSAADRLAGEYDVDRATVKGDLEALIQKLMDIGLLRTVDAS